VAFCDDLTTIRNNLVAELKAETARRAALTAAGNPPPATYTSAGKTISWNEYMQTMLDRIAKLNEQVIAAGGDGGIIDEVTHGYT